MHQLKKCIRFYERVIFSDVCELDYYDMFVNIFCNDLVKFPLCVTHLTFGNKFNQDIKSAITASVTHLTFGRNFNQDIKSAIPASITHLTFGYSFNQDIRSAIPTTVQYITSRNKSIVLNIPT